MNLKPTIRIIRRDTFPGALNMALDEAIFLQYNHENNPILRFYQWEKPTLSLGYFQKSTFFSHLKNYQQIDIVRRPTGGRAVIHHLELTYSIIAGYDPVFNGKNLVDSYYLIAQLFRNSFKQLHIKIDIEKAKIKDNSPNCFSSPSLFEITLNGFKIIGSAQYRKEGKFLQHGAIIFDIDYDIWQHVYKLDKEKLVNSVKGINNIVQQPITYDQLEAAIIKSFSEYYSLNIGKITQKETKIANDLLKNKYLSNEWTYRR